MKADIRGLEQRRRASLYKETSDELPVTLGLAIALAIASALWASAADPPEPQLRGLIPKIVRAWESMNIGTVDAGPQVQPHALAPMNPNENCTRKNTAKSMTAAPRFFGGLPGATTGSRKALLCARVTTGVPSPQEKNNAALVKALGRTDRPRKRAARRERPER